MKHKTYLFFLTFGLLISIVLFSGIELSFANKAHHHHTRDIVESNQSPYIQMMDEMMDKMHTAEKEDTRCTYTNFLSSMIPHHEGAIIMSEYEIKHGKNPEMIALAKQIIAEQKKEIAEMKAMLASYKVCPQGEQVTQAYQKAMAQTMEPMMKDFPTTQLNAETNPDRAFALAMIPHHQAAVDMAKVILQYSKEPNIVKLSKSIIESQEKEITQMKEYLNK